MLHCRMAVQCAPEAEKKIDANQTPGHSEIKSES